MGSVVRQSLSDGEEKMEKVFQLIIQNPGIGISKLAKLSEMSRNYIIWILPRMELTGRLLTEGENGKLYFSLRLKWRITLKTFLIYSVMWLLIAGCVQNPPPVEIEPDIAPIVTAEGCGDVELEQITYTVGERGVTLVSAGDQCYGFYIKSGMGMVIMPTLPEGAELRLSLNGQAVEMEKLDFGMYGKQITEAGNYILAVDVPDNVSGTKLLVVVNNVR